MLCLCNMQSLLAQKLLSHQCHLVCPLDFTGNDLDKIAQDFFVTLTISLGHFPVLVYLTSQQLSALMSTLLPQLLPLAQCQGFLSLCAQADTWPLLIHGYCPNSQQKTHLLSLTWNRVTSFKNFSFIIFPFLKKCRSCSNRIADKAFVLQVVEPGVIPSI